MSWRVVSWGQSAHEIVNMPYVETNEKILVVSDEEMANHIATLLNKAAQAKTKIPSYNEVVNSIRNSFKDIEPEDIHSLTKFVVAYNNADVGMKAMYEYFTQYFDRLTDVTCKTRSDDCPFIEHKCKAEKGICSRQRK